MDALDISSNDITGGLMMLMHSIQATILIQLTDADGYEVGRSVPVTIEYAQTIIPNYCEDADSRCSMPRIEYDLLDVSLDTPTLRTLSIHQAEQVIAEAQAIFHQRNARIAR